jgi:hypothetical protein
MRATNRTVWVTAVLALVGTCVSTPLAVPISNYKDGDPVTNGNAVLTIRETGFGDGWYVTGTGVGFSVTTGGTLNPALGNMWNCIKLLEVRAVLPTGTTTVYPLEGVDSPDTDITSLQRVLRCDSTAWGGSVEGATVQVELQADYRLRKLVIIGIYTVEIGGEPSSPCPYTATPMTQ